MKKLNCYQGLKLTHILFFGGLGLMALGLMLGSLFDGSGLIAVLAAVGAILVAGGLVCGWMFIKCPECGHSLTPGGRVPNKIPNYCPHCGKML